MAIDTELLAELYGDDMVLMDGFDDALVGVVCRYGAEPMACYSREKVLDILQDRDGMDRDDAVDFFEFNQIGAWLGDRTPCFIEDLPD